MPEMPEIETLARALRKTILGKCVVDVHLSGLSLRRPVSGSLASKLRGRTIRRILRRGKYLVAQLEPKAFWLIHLGMSGQILYHASAQKGAIHTHAIVRFSDATELHYRDHRRFGLLAAYEVPSLGQVPEIRSLGKDPLSTGFNDKYLLSLLAKSRREIKAFLLDQRKVAGLGNIYACESLFLARIHPKRRCFTLALREANCLAGSIREVLRLAIKNHGTSFSDFVDSNGELGENQSNLMVFQREGKECIRCGRPIQRIRQGNRSSFYCSYCQD
jgi:formamidopyrimidine-DNA glycosylase